MKPYYDQEGITIYHGNCADVLPLVEPSMVGLLLTDPPYGIGFQSGAYWQHRRTVGDDKPFDPRPLLAYPRLVLWGAHNFAAYLPVGGWFVWDKRDQVSRNLPGSDAEMAWTNLHPRIQIIRHLWMPHTMRNEPLLHPNQKPVSVIRRLVEEWTAEGDLIFDPYMGSGPVAQVAFESGRRYIGVEIVEAYCEVAVRRLAQGVLTFDGETP